MFSLRSLWLHVIGKCSRIKHSSKFAFVPARQHGRHRMLPERNHNGRRAVNTRHCRGEAVVRKSSGQIGSWNLFWLARGESVGRLVALGRDMCMLVQCYCQPSFRRKGRACQALELRHESASNQAILSTLGTDLWPHHCQTKEKS